MGGEENKGRVLSLSVVIFIVGLSIVLLLMSSSYPYEAQRMPRLAAIGLIVFGAPILLLEMRLLSKGKREKIFSKELFLNNGMMVVVTMIIYVALLKILGFLLDTVMYMAINAYLLGMNSKLNVVLFSTISTFIVYYLFQHVFSVHLPEGILFNSF